MITNNLSSTIVLELLRNDNYENWSAWMKNYLLAQDLWDIVEATMEPPKPEDDEVEFKAWRKNNAAALHAILISCGLDILLEIRKISSAKIVWEKLATMYGPSNSSNSPSDSNIDISEVSLAGEGSINNDLLQYQPLITAIEDGDWDYAKDFLREHEEAKRATVSVGGYTILHEAVFVRQTEIVEKLVELMSPEELKIRDDDGWTALALAVFLQNTRMVECMLRKNPNLFNIPDNHNCIPLVLALEDGNMEVAHCLYSRSLPSQTLRDIDASTALTQFILLNKFDLALHLLDRYPRAAIGPDKYDSSPLQALATKSSAFPSGKHLVFWKNWIYACIPIRSVQCAIDHTQIEIDNPNEHQNDQEGIGSVLGLLRRLPSNLLTLLGIKQLYEMKLLHHQACHLLHNMCNEVDKKKGDAVIGAMFEATKGGIVEFIDELVKADHSLLHHQDRMGRNIFFNAVLHRQPKIFSLICNLKVKNSITNVLDRSDSTILHMAAMLEPSTTTGDRIPGEALKMQSEFRWFKKVERICHPGMKDIRNDTKMTARELFTHNHMNMKNEEEKWMKDVASACTVIGTLIIGIMFAVAFTVPGGNDQNTGFPMFSHKKLFRVFIISDVLSLLSSSTSVMIFLKIVASHYAEEDFSQSLPLMMVIGQYTIFFSIATMMIAFYTGLFIMLPEKSWLVILATCLSSGTAIQFALLAFPLLAYMLEQMFPYGQGMEDL